MTTTRRKGILGTTRNDFLTVRLRAIDGRLAYLLEGHPDILKPLLSRLPADLTVRPAPALPPLALHESATATLRLPSHPRAVPVDPDPLGDFARVFAGVGADEFAEVQLAISPADAPKSRSENKPIRVPKVDAATLFATARELVNTDPFARPKPVTPRPVSAPIARDGKPEQSAQVYLRFGVSSHAFAGTAERARELALAALTPFHAWEPSGSLRASYSGPASADLLTGSHPGRGSSRVVPAASISGLLLPPTARCSATNVRRTAASAPVPADLPGLGPGVLPLGTPDGAPAPIGIFSRDVLFMFSMGRAGFGKTSQAEIEILALTRPQESGGSYDGGCFIDPHRDAVQVLQNFYWDCPERLLRIDLGQPWDGARLPIYNPLDAYGCSDEEAERRVAAVVGGFMSFPGLGKSATRARPIITQSALLLVEMARLLGPDAPVPTIFQIPTVLTNEDWREKVLRDRRLPEGIRRWWADEFARYPKEAPLPVTQVVSLLRASTPITAFLGGRSTFSFRETMDNRGVILYAGVLSGSDKDQLITSLFVRALLQATYSRSNVPEQRRDAECPRFWIYGDEVPTWDGPDLAHFFQEARKFRVRMKIMAQTPAKLLKSTWEAGVTNASLLTSTAVDGEGAGMMAKLWRGPGAADMPEIEQFHHLVSATVNGKRTEAFLVKGMQPQDLFEARPGVVEASIATDPRYRNVADVVVELEDLDDRLLKAWTGGAEPERGGTVSVDE